MTPAGARWLSLPAIDSCNGRSRAVPEGQDGASRVTAYTEGGYLSVSYYNRSALWGPDSAYGGPEERERAHTIVEAVPASSSTVLDVGCGDGLVTNLLAERYDTVGVDITPVALEHVRAKSVIGAAEDLPFDDLSFDTVVLAEVIEHLDDRVFAATREEAARVARTHILVTVPNNENLYAGLVRCPRCGIRFHRNCHERAFKPGHMEGLFPHFKLEFARTIGPQVERVTTLEAALRRRLARNPPLPYPAVCPRCGDEGQGKVAVPQGLSLQGLRRFGLARLARRRQPRWILARYERAAT